MNKYPKIIDEFETIEKIIKDKCSICRLGDGELRLAIGISLTWQKHSLELEKRLCEILKSKKENILVGLPNLNNINKTKYLNHWKKYYYGQKFLKLFDKNNKYYSTWISRGDDSPKIMCHKYWNLFKEIWKDRDIVVIEGPRNDEFLLSKCELLKNCKSMNIIKGTRHAFSNYKQILSKCLKYNKESIFIISLGPTATVLAYDLGLKGYQALDVGRIAHYYIYFQRGEWKNKVYYDSLYS